MSVPPPRARRPHTAAVRRWPPHSPRRRPLFRRRLAAFRPLRAAFRSLRAKPLRRWASWRRRAPPQRRSRAKPRRRWAAFRSLRAKSRRRLAAFRRPHTAIRCSPPSKHINKVRVRLGKSPIRRPQRAFRRNRERPVSWAVRRARRQGRGRSPSRRVVSPCRGERSGKGRNAPDRRGVRAGAAPPFGSRRRVRPRNTCAASRARAPSADAGRATA